MSAVSSNRDAYVPFFSIMVKPLMLMQGRNDSNIYLYLSCLLACVHFPKCPTYWSSHYFHLLEGHPPTVFWKVLCWRGLHSLCPGGFPSPSSVLHYLKALLHSAGFPCSCPISGRGLHISTCCCEFTGLFKRSILFSIPLVADVALGLSMGGFS